MRTYGDLCRLAAETFTLGYSSLSWYGRSYPVRAGTGGFPYVEIPTMNGLLKIFRQPHDRTLPGKIARAGSVIVRVELNGKTQLFGIIDNRFVENIERECTRAVVDA